MSVEKVGVFGGTFDPIHIGHLAAAQDAASTLELARVLFVPNRLPPHKQGQTVTGVDQRVAMVRLCVDDNPLFQLSTIELERDGPSYTLDTMRELRAQLGAETRLVFLAGCDSLNSLHTWHEPRALLDEFDVAVLERPTGSVTDWAKLEQQLPGIRERVTTVPVPQLDVSAADLRQRVRQGRPIRYYVLPEVEEYIHDHDLYVDA